MSVILPQSSTVIAGDLFKDRLNNIKEEESAPGQTADG